MEGGGGGIFAAGSLITMVNSTVADNYTYDGADHNINVYAAAETLMIRSIVAEFYDQGFAYNCAGPITDGGGNYANDGSCGVGFGELTGFDPELRDNGGPTLTHALLEDSSAVDATDCMPAVDQRGVPRDGACE